MEHPKQQNRFRRFLASTPVATIGFICIVGLLTYLGSRLFGGILMRELHRYDDGALRESRAVPSAAVSPSPEPGKAVALLLTPAPGAPTPGGTPVSAPSPTPSPSASPSAGTSPTPAPRATLRPVVQAGAFTKERVDFLFYALDGEGRVDWVTVVALREDGCTALSIPRNTLSGEKGTLMDAAGFRTLNRMLEQVFPVRFSRHVELQTEGIPACVDAFGGVTLAGGHCDGAAAAKYVGLDGQDEMLRISRQQAFLGAYLRSLKSAGAVKLLASKFTLQAYVDSDFTIGQIMELYGVLSGYRLADVTFATLPVDSVSVNGKRCYKPDIPLVNAILQRLYPEE